MKMFGDEEKVKQLRSDYMELKNTPGMTIKSVNENIAKKYLCSYETIRFAFGLSHNCARCGKDMTGKGKTKLCSKCRCEKQNKQYKDGRIIKNEKHEMSEYRMAANEEKRQLKQKALDELLSTIKTGDRIVFENREERTKPMQGEIIQITDRVIAVVDERGFRQSLGTRTIYCGGIVVSVAS